MQTQNNNSWGSEGQPLYPNRSIKNPIPKCSLSAFTSWVLQIGVAVKFSKALLICCIGNCARQSRQVAESAAARVGKCQAGFARISKYARGGAPPGCRPVGPRLHLMRITARRPAGESSIISRLFHANFHCLVP